jgi:gliding motility-associated-like protein
MKGKITLLTLFFAFFSFPLFSQCPPPGFPAPGDMCPDAPILCANLDGYCATINENNVPQGFPGCPGNALNNDEWFAFYAGTTSITIEIVPENCQAEDPAPQGMQAAVYQGCGGPVMDTQCNCTTSTIVLSANNFIVGEIYWIVVDGCAGDVCDYTVNVTQGNTVGNAPQDPTPISGLQDVCLDDITNYSLPPVTGATIYNWTLNPPLGAISGTGNSIDITWALPGTTNLCLTVENACFANPNQVCYPINVEANPIVNIQPAPFITCNTFEVQLNGAGSATGPGITYQWTTLDGNIVSGANTLTPTVNSEGTYTLTVTNTTTTCTSELDVVVNEDTTLPIATAGPPIELNCVLPQAPLFGFGSTTGPGITYLWTTPDGNIVSGETTLSPQVNAPGTYTLTVTNNNNGCVSEASVVVTVDADTPVAEAGPDQLLTCVDSEVTIDATGSSMGSQYSFVWSTNDGNIVSGATTNMPVVDQPGTYQLIVFNTNNGCQDTSSVVVTSDQLPPSVIIIPPQDINCSFPSIIIDGSNSSSGDFTYAWTTPDGNIVTGADSPNAEVDQAGTYTLTVTNNITGCEEQETVLVTGDIINPTLQIETPDEISCTDPEVILDATNSDSGPNFVYTWTTPDGVIISGDDTATPTVGAGGTYELTILNTTTNCSTTETVDVIENADIPTAAIDPVSELNCTLVELQLNGDITGGPNLTFTWTTPDGNFVSGTNTLTPIVDAAGTYNLSVTDTDSGCEESTSVVVTQDALIPAADAGPDGELTCSVTTIDLDGTNSDDGPAITYQWTTSDGNIISGGDTETPMIDAPGTYILQVLNSDNTCESVDTVEITENVVILDAQIEPPLLLGCADPTITLDGTNSSSGGNITYQWTTPDGNIISGDDTNAAVIDAPGTYTLVLLDPTNDCTDSEQTVVVQNLDVPVVDAGQDGSITCTITEVQLDGTAGGAIGNFIYQWTTPDGNIVSGGDQLDPVVDQAGTYTLTVIDTINQCSATSTVDVIQDADVPISVIDQTNPLNCTFTSVTLDGAASTQGPNLVYSWSTLDGNIVNNPDAQSAVIDQAGSYTLTIQDTVNLCVSSSTVTVTPDTLSPVLNIISPDELTCTITEVTLSGDAGSLPDIDITWSTTDGNIVADGNTFTPLVDQPGTYTMTITNNENGCEAIEETIVTSDVDLPIVDAGPTGTINCIDLDISLTGSGDAGGAAVDYQWTTLDGNIVSGADTPNPVIDAGGTYSLTVTNTENGCADSADVTIDQDQQSPVADPGIDGLLNCFFPEIQLDASSSSTGAEFTYQWTTADGNIVSGDDSVTPTVDATGTYTLTVTNTINGCETVNTVAVTDDFAVPSADAGADPALSCSVTSTNLSGTGSTGVEFTYQWTTTDGNIVNGATTLTPEIDLPGTYQLEVFNTANGCNAFSEVTVTLDASFPVAVATADAPITCTVPTINIDGAGTDTGPNFTYNWTTLDGNIVSGDDSLNPAVDLPGTYTLSVTNEDNDCVSTTEVEVQIDTIAPVAEAGMTNILTCTIEELNLDGTGSSAGTDFQYTWTTTDGNIVSGANDLNPLIDAPGTYQILVTNLTNGCETIDVVDIGEDVDLPTVVATVTEILTCETTSLNLSGTGSSTGTEFIYNWSTTDGNIVNGSTTLDPEVNEPGQYLLTIENTDNGCVAETTVNVDQDITPPTLVFTDPSVLTCITEIVNVSAAGSSSGANFAQTWSTIDGNIVSGDNTLEIEVDQPGTYTLLITNSDNGCTTEDVVQVTEDVELPVVDAGDDFVLPCIEDMVNLEGSASASSNSLQYDWQTVNGLIVSGATTLTPEISAGGLYTLTVTNLANGCEDVDEVEITEDLPTDPIVSSENPLCSDAFGSIEVSGVEAGSPPYTYSIDGGETFFTSPIFVNLEEGDYSVIVQDALGCESGIVESFIDIPDPIQVFAETDVEIQQGDTYQIDLLLNVPESSVESVQWTPSIGLSCDTCLNPLANPLSTTIYEVEVIVEGDCRTTEEVVLFVDERPLIFAPNIFSPDNDGNNDIFYLFGREENIAQIRSFLVFDRWGASVCSYTNFQPNDPAFGWDGTHKGQLLNPAVFVWYAEVEMIDGRIEFFEGDVTLVR